MLTPEEISAISVRNAVILEARRRISVLKQAGCFVNARETAQGVEIETRTSNFSKCSGRAFEIIPWR